MRHSEAQSAADAQLNPVRGTRRLQHGGLYDACHSAPGEPTGSGPGWEAALEAYRKRQSKLGEVGIWRHTNGFPWKKNSGTTRDINYAIIEW